MKAVDSEHSKNINSDVWRLQELLRSISSQDGKLHFFRTGNLETLKQDNIVEKLLEFHNRYYSANIMSLAVLGKESTEELEAWVTEIFSLVPNKEIERPLMQGIPFTANETNKLVKVVPVKSLRDVRIVWPCPSTRELYDYKPHRYLSHLLGHEGKNSLLSYLKAKGLAQELSTGSYPSYSNFSVFNIRVELTEKGLREYESVV